MCSSVIITASRISVCNVARTTPNPRAWLLLRLNIFWLSLNNFCPASESACEPPASHKDGYELR
ncbi:hypothetical protein SBV1_810031 [Verrucomicrobia bacterium]|nr:hypothetical protein SBV1_810031 [Verrucomicrobiota bacterium]